jgi:hypothetical protein
MRHHQRRPDQLHGPGPPDGRLEGVGVRHGAEGFLKYTRLQAISANRFPMRRDMHMIPYEPSAYRFLLRLVDVMYGTGLRGRAK